MSNETKQFPEGPTLNRAYNGVLESWKASGHDHTPECEECGENLTGKKVFGTSLGWFCRACIQEAQAQADDTRDH